MLLLIGLQLEKLMIEGITMVSQATNLSIMTQTSMRSLELEAVYQTNPRSALNLFDKSRQLLSFSAL